MSTGHPLLVPLRLLPFSPPLPTQARPPNSHRPTTRGSFCNRPLRRNFLMCCRLPANEGASGVAQHQHQHHSQHAPAAPACRPHPLPLPGYPLSGGGDGKSRGGRRGGRLREEPGRRWRSAPPPGGARWEEPGRRWRSTRLAELRRWNHTARQWPLVVRLAELLLPLRTHNAGEMKAARAPTPLSTWLEGPRQYAVHCSYPGSSDLLQGSPCQRTHNRCRLARALYGLLVLVRPFILDLQLL
jgi:hypothetical protein